MTKIIVSGITREQDIDFINQYLPDYAGFYYNNVYSQPSTSSIKASKHIRLLIPGVNVVGYFAGVSSEKYVLDVASELDVIAFASDVDSDFIFNIKAKTGKEIWQCYFPTNAVDFNACTTIVADMNIVFYDFESQGIDNISLPTIVSDKTILAGTITPKNAVKIAKKFSPYGIDLSIGVNTNGLKDKAKLSSTIASIRRIQERKR